MDRFPYEILFCIATQLDSPKDLCAFSAVSSKFKAVARDDRLWKQFCRRLYRISPPAEPMHVSFYHLFTKTLVPYGRYLGYWKSNERFIGGLIHVELNLSNGTLLACKVNVINQTAIPMVFFDVDSDEEGEEITEENSHLRPICTRSPLFSIDPSLKAIYCYLCSRSHADLPWMTTHPVDRPHFGLSQEILPEGQRVGLITRDAMDIAEHPGADIYFLLHCSDDASISYRPLSIPRPLSGEGAHPLARLNGVWVGSYGGHGLEILHVHYSTDFSYSMPDENDDEPLTETVPHALIARKISGDPNVPHGQVSFATIRSLTDRIFSGVGQIAHTGFVDHRYIPTRVEILSENFLKVTWFALHHTSSFRRCSL